MLLVDGEEMEESDIERAIFNFESDRKMKMSPLEDKDNQFFGGRLFEVNVLKV